MFRWNFLCYRFCPLPLVLLLGTTKMSLTPSSWHPAFRKLWCSQSHNILADQIRSKWKTELTLRKQQLKHGVPCAQTCLMRYTCCEFHCCKSDFHPFQKNKSLLKRTTQSLQSYWACLQRDSCKFVVICNYKFASLFWEVVSFMHTALKSHTEKKFLYWKFLFSFFLLWRRQEVDVYSTGFTIKITMKRAIS